MEAISFGIPIIATNVGGTAEIVTPETGILIDKDFDVKQLASILDEFKKTPYYSGERRKNIKNFWNQHFNSSINTENFLNSFKKVTYEIT